MDNNQVGVISCLLILLASKSTKHIDFANASPITGLSQENENVNHFQRNTNNGSFGDTRNQQAFGAHAGYGKHIDKGVRGARGKLNIWSPNVSVGDVSTAAITIGQVHNGINVELAAGWMINPGAFQDQRPRFFASYLNRSVGPTSCYNFVTNCVGFIMTRHEVFLRPINQTSVHTGARYSHDVVIIQDDATKSWRLEIDNLTVGYWSYNLVSTFNDGASNIGWTGQVYNSGNSTKPTPMGSGKPPEEGYGKASFINDVQYINKTWSALSGGNFRKLESHPRHYRAGHIVFGLDNKLIFYYGNNA